MIWDRYGNQGPHSKGGEFGGYFGWLEETEWQNSESQLSAHTWSRLYPILSGILVAVIPPEVLGLMVVTLSEMAPTRRVPSRTR